MPEINEQLLVVMLLALAVPALLGRLKRFRVPAVVAEVLAGILVGKSGLNFVHPDAVVTFLAYLGLAYLMLLSGLEIDFDLFRGGRPVERGWRGLPLQPLTLAALFLVVGVGGSYFVAGRLAAAGLVPNAIVAAFILATSALTLVVPVLKEQGLSDSPYGQLLMTSNALLDFVPMLGLTVALAWVHGSVLQALVVFPAIGMVVLLWRFGLRLGVPGWLELAARSTAQLGMRAGLVLLLLFLYLAQRMGIEAVIAAFLAGMLLSLLTGEGRGTFIHRADALGFGFLIPIFFVSVGVNFDLGAVLGDPKALLLVPLILLASLLTKGVPVLLLRIWYPWRQTVGAALLSSAQISVTIAAATVAVQAGAISKPVQMAIILAAMLSALIMPTLFLKLVPSPAQGPEPPVLLAGSGPLAALLLHRLLGEGRRVLLYGPVAYEPHPQLAVGGDLLLASELATLGPLRAALFLYGDDAQNVLLAEALRRRAEVPCVALVGSAAHYNRSVEGVRLVSPVTATVDLMASLLDHPVATRVLQGGSEVRMLEVVVRSSLVVGHALKDLRLPPRCLVALVERDGKDIVPRGDTRLLAGDVLTVLVPASEEEQIRRMFTLAAT